MADSISDLYNKIELRLPEALLEKIESGEATASDLREARMWLQDYQPKEVERVVVQSAGDGKVFPFQAVTAPVVDPDEEDCRETG